MSAEARIAELGLQLPEITPQGVYRPVSVAGNMAYTSGHPPLRPDGSMVKGRVGEDLDVEEGYQAAKLTGLAILASLRAELGSLDRVRRVVKVLGLVNAAADFTQHPAVINGCSELFRDVFGPRAGLGARSAVGAGSLPQGIAVEIEAIFEIRNLNTPSE